VPNSIIISKSNITSLNESTDIQQIQPLHKPNANSNTHQADILLQNNIPSCINQDGGLRGDGFNWYSDEDTSENEQQEIEK
jgi:hypothetical protein